MRSKPSELKDIFDKLSTLTTEQADAVERFASLCDKDIRPLKLEISCEEQEKIDEVMAVFQEYIDGHYFFDILHSKKFGYIRMDIDGLWEQYGTADDILFHCIIPEISGDVRALKLCGEQMKTTLFPEEEAELRKRVAPYFEKLPDPDHCYEILDEYVLMLAQAAGDAPEYDEEENE